MQEKDKIAVIGIHGVSSHTPLGTLIATVQMLLREFPQCYTPYSETRELVRVEPIVTDAWKMEASGKTVTPPTIVDESHEFSRDILKNYWREHKEDDPAEYYETVCLHTERRESPPGGQARQRGVDTYSLFWDDLSQIGTGFINIIGELYHMLFHLPDIAVKTLGLAGQGFWKSLATVATVCLTRLVPFLNLLLFAVLSVVFPLALPREMHTVAAALLILIVAGTVVGKVLWDSVNRNPERYNESTHRLPGLSFLLVLPVALVGFVLYQGIVQVFQVLPSYFLAGAWWAGLLSAFVVGLLAFRQRYPSAFRWGIASLLVAIGALGHAWYSTSPPGPREGTLTPGLPDMAERVHLITIALRAGEYLYFLLACVWLLFGLCLFVAIPAWIAGRVIAWVRQRGRAALPKMETEDRKIERAHITGLIGIAVPSILMLVLTLTLWAGVGAALSIGVKEEKKFSILPATFPAPKDEKPVFMTYDPLWLQKSGPCHHRLDRAGNCDDAQEALSALLFASPTPAFPIVLGLLAVSLLIVGWVMFPSAMGEQNPPKREEARKLSGVLGKWLTHGARVLIWALVCVLLTQVILFLGLLLEFIHWIGLGSLEPFRDKLKGLYEITAQALGWFGGAIASSAIALATLGQRLDSFALSFRQVIEVLFDVDQHVREFPKGSTPRARIAARYASLLRHLCREKQYKAIVINAHSQGSIITADLLKFLKDEQIAAQYLGNTPIYLLTFGCPLRQLYSLRFPHLYAWARVDGGPPVNALSDNVQCWVNIYHTGDYVGRFVGSTENGMAHDDWNWTFAGMEASDDAAKRWPRLEKALGGAEAKTTIQDFCIGAGAHIRYWDYSTPELAVALDALIARASADSGPKTPKGP